MKKTFNINIGNSIIHIEEDGYELLTSYLKEVKQHFGKSADDFEIVNDIENRIAEMFLEILQSQQKQVIELGDVQVVMAMMGSVKDFDQEGAEEAAPGFEQTEHSTFAERKVYRDTDDAMIAGVCSGLSHYLHVDISVLRIITVLTTFFAGSGILAYLILWVSMPKARTRSEKMAMKGEAINLQGFKRNFEEEMSSLRDNLQNAGEHFEPLVKRSGTFIGEFVEVLGRFLQGTGKTIFRIIAILIVIMGSLAFLTALIALAAALGFGDSSTNQFFPLNILDDSYYTTVAFATFITVAVPILALILFSVRVAFNSRPFSKTLAYGMLLIWLGGLSVGIYYIAKISYEFKEEAEFTQTTPLKTLPLYQLAIDKSRFFTKEDSLRYQLNSADYAGKVIMNDNDHDNPFNLPRNVSLDIEKSENTTASLTESYRSQGRDFEQALNYAKNIGYDFKQADSTLRFSTAIHLKKDANWRDQRVRLILRLPVGAKVKIDRDLNSYIMGFSLWDCEDHYDDGYYYGIMTTEGLKCMVEN